MSRSRRLLELLQLLRRHRLPVAGRELAEELGISLRTLYRDLDTLRTQGAHIDGEAGVGYVLRPGFTIPPLMFSEDEIEAIMLGASWVEMNGDAKLSGAANDVLAKIEAVVPEPLREHLRASSLMVGTEKKRGPERIDVALIREAIRSGHKVKIAYRDQKRSATLRIVWPFGLGYFEETRVLAAWCELRDAIRHFRTDRIDKLTILDERYPRSRTSLLTEWRSQQDPSPPEQKTN